MQSVTLLGTTSGKINVTGDPQRGAGFSNTIGNNHTVSIGISNFIGRIWIEGSIESSPGENDWVPIPLIGTVPYLQFPVNPHKPVSDLSAYGQAVGDSGNFVYNFTGNFIWVRARVDRTYISPPPVSDSLVGAVIKVLMNYGSVTPAGITTQGSNLSTGGIVGPPGPQGLPGPTGPAGTNGTIGVNGDTGPTGPEGIATNTGATGPQGLQGPTGAPGSASNTGATGPIGPAGSGGVNAYSFKVTFASNGGIDTVSNVPPGWTVVKSSATTIAVTHNLGKNPFMITAEGQVVAGSNSVLNYTLGPLKTVASSFQITYSGSPGTPSSFTITSITSPNVFGTVNSGESTVYVHFI